MAKPRAEKTGGAKAPEFVLAIKGFDSDLSCRGFKYEIGQTYTHAGRVQACSGGYHSITGHPLAVFEYYPPAGSRFCRVEVGGATGAEIGITELVNDAIAWVTARTHPEGESATGYRGAASATGYRGAASATGDRGAASATGDQGAAMAPGKDGRVKGSAGCVLFAVERGDWDGRGYPAISAASGIVGQDGIEPGVWYAAKAGKLVAQ